MSRASSPIHTDLYIGGSWRKASAGEPIQVLDPATGAVFAEVASASVDDALSAVASAADALPAWSRTAPRERGEVLRRTFELMMQRQQSLAELIVRENGKAMNDAVSEVRYAAEFFRWYAEEAVRALGEVSRAPSGSNRILVQLQPIGVSVLVTPWNFPAAMATRKIGPALAAGCTVVLKPASDTPLTALAIAAVMQEAGAPAGVVNVIPSARSGKVVGAMLHDPRVRKLSFTGSTEVGRVLLAQAADCIVSSSMELGGNAPFLVFDDADVEAAVAGAMIAKMRNGGQACTAANRFLVQKGIAPAFVQRFTEAMRAVKVGNGLESGVGLGPLINAAACNTVQELVDDAVGSGARVLTGGRKLDGKGYFYPPTVLDRVQSGSRILTQEIFGPVAPIIEFETEQQGIELANATEYGLVSYLYTSDLRRGLRVAEQLEAGMVGLNRGVVSDPAAPFGGVKQSGLGREGSHDGLLEFLEKKYIALDW
ncbi:MAG TPA: NAD-dependent succinate-semialdehyde dehydrogenase [Steroidobacteraceae bacterium]|jgi:succinate-semialdehyde dehydrogenase / glutarate-semialdehyde dehydrogenase|nr:NAD-dependent succinate-semialdehyde dehydrogenase [Steroidobacteraceae bacterium]